MPVTIEPTLDYTHAPLIATVTDVTGEILNHYKFYHVSDRKPNVYVSHEVILPESYPDKIARPTDTVYRAMEDAGYIVLPTEVVSVLDEKRLSPTGEVEVVDTYLVTEPPEQTGEPAVVRSLTDDELTRVMNHLNIPYRLIECGAAKFDTGYVAIQYWRTDAENDDIMHRETVREVLPEIGDVVAGVPEELDVADGGQSSLYQFDEAVPTPPDARDSTRSEEHADGA